MPKWEIKRLFIPLNIDVIPEQIKLRLGTAEADWFNPFEDEETEKGWAEASTLALEGWELVGAIPIVRGHEFHSVNTSRGSSHTRGYILLFKRLRIPAKTITDSGRLRSPVPVVSDRSFRAIAIAQERSDAGVDIIHSVGGGKQWRVSFSHGFSL